MHKLAYAMVVLAAASSCAASDESAPGGDQIATAQAAMINLSGATRGLSTTGVRFEDEMSSARASKLPVSWVWSGVTTQSGPGSYCCNKFCTIGGGRAVDFRASCVNGSDGPDTCDPALFVYAQDWAQYSDGSWTGGSTRVFNNDDYSDTATSGASNARGAYLRTITCGPGNTSDYFVQAYSSIRGTSNVHVEMRVNGGPWTTAFRTGTTRSGANPGWIYGNSQTVGGTMVKIGPLQANDFMMLQSPTATTAQPSASAAGANSRMWVFNPTKNLVSGPQDDPVYGTRNQGTFYLSAGWTGGTSANPSDSYALVSLGTTQLGGPGEAERFYDLVHYPVNAGATTVGSGSQSNTSTTSRVQGYCPAGAYLAPGHWQWKYQASTTFPVGQAPHWDGSWHSTAEVGYDDNNGVSRGTGNDLAFKVSLVKSGGAVLQTRLVPRGALGATAGTNNTFVLDQIVPDDGATSPNNYYFLCFDQIGAHVTVQGAATLVRNQDTAEIRVVTANIEYKDEDDNAQQGSSELKNMVDFLGRSADYSGKTVAFKDTRGRWRFDADIVNLNEIIHDSARVDTMTNRLNAASAFKDAWNASVGPSRYCADTLAWCWDRYGVLYGNPRVKPAGAWADGSPIHREPKVNVEIACDNSTAYGNADTVGCKVRDGTQQDDYTFPLRGAANRVSGYGGYTGAPVMTLHMYFQSEGDKVVGRYSEMLNLTSFAKELLKIDPYGFNAAGSIDPMHPGNRIVILGDSNMQNTSNSEVNQSLSVLRGAFGYAIDVAQAATDRNDQYARSFDTHYSGVPLMTMLYGMYGSDGRPAYFTSNATWHSHPGLPSVARYRVPGPQDLGMQTSWLPWWATTETGPSSWNEETTGGAGERLDIILLAGRGWANDDPVRQYLIPPTAEKPSLADVDPMAGRAPDGSIELGAVDIRRYCNLIDRVNGSAATSYEPEFGDTCPPGDGKQVAWRSDHKPVGVRLRVRY